MTVRTRFAPSPTGYMHVGGVRTALFAWLIAQQNNGTFILRIEDTDKTREVEGAITQIEDSLRWLGINWQEGIDSGGEYGPYLQSDRLAIYKEWADKMVASGRAYADPYSPQELDAFREQAKADKRPFLYRDHRPENPPAWDGTQPLRFKSDPKRHSWHDAVMGDMSAGPEAIDDFIIMKSDGYPTYNFAHIIDDMLMGVTHVLRSQEFISSTPKFLNLYEALGFDMDPPQSSRSSTSSEETSPVHEFSSDVGTRLETRSEAVSEDFGGEEANMRHTMPILATLPFVMAIDGKKKLSKRDGAKDILTYASEGYLPEAMTNFLATLGWNDGTEQEVFATTELIEKFSLDRVQKSPARFDEQRLLWLNGQHIRLLSLDDLMNRVRDFWSTEAADADEAYKRQVLALAQDRLKTLADLPTLTSYFFSEPTPDWSMIDDNKQLKKLDRNRLVELLQQSLTALETTDFTPESLQATLNTLLETTGEKPGILFSLIRFAITWAPFSPALPETMTTLGRDRVLARLQTAIHAA